MSRCAQICPPNDIQCTLACCAYSAYLMGVVDDPRETAAGLQAERACRPSSGRHNKAAESAKPWGNTVRQGGGGGHGFFSQHSVVEFVLRSTSCASQSSDGTCLVAHWRMGILGAGEGGSRQLAKAVVLDAPALKTVHHVTANSEASTGWCRRHPCRHVGARILSTGLSHRQPNSSPTKAITAENTQRQYKQRPPEHHGPVAGARLQNPGSCSSRRPHRRRSE